MKQRGAKIRNQRPNLTRFAVAQTIVCTASERPQVGQGVTPRKSRLPNRPEKQLNNATKPVLIGYARVSLAEGQDLAPQVSALEAAGCRRIHEERASGGRWDRPELTRLLGRLTAGDCWLSGNSTVCHDLSRTFC